jgi:hypothetical protein
MSSEQSRASAEWQTPPRRFGKITNEQLEIIDESGERFAFMCSIGCGLGAAIALVAAAIAWGDALLIAIGSPL